MDFDSIGAANMNNLFFLGQLLALAGLGYGAWLCFLHAGKHGNPLDWKSADFPIPTFPARGEARFGKSAAPLPLLPEDLRLTEGLVRYDPDDHSLSGHGVMDMQHQRLSDYANNLRATILSGQPADEVNAMIDVFIRDMVQHFQDEEAILAAANYPGTAKHAALHRELVTSAATLVERFRAGASSIGELFRFLAHDVLAKHMRDADREFVSYSASRP
jgi:hemerythrin-like metal-binding protein